MNKWMRVKFADECIPCECCGEPWCSKCDEHYSSCECLGPIEDNVEYKRVEGVLYGRRK